MLSCQPHPLTGAFSESSSSSLVKRLKQSWSETFPPAKLFCRGRGSGEGPGGGWGGIGVAGGLHPIPTFGMGRERSQKTSKVVER